MTEIRLWDWCKSLNKDGSGANTRFVILTLIYNRFDLSCKTIVFRFFFCYKVIYRIESPMAPQQSAVEIRILLNDVRIFQVHS